MIVICDLDGTLTKTGAELANNCMGETHSKEDILRIMDPIRVARLDCNEEIADEIRAHHRNGAAVLIITGRWNLLEEVTMAWLRANNIPYHAIAMRYHEDWKEKSTLIKSRAFEQLMATRRAMGLPNDKVVWYDDDEEMLAIAESSFGCDVRKVS